MAHITRPQFQRTGAAAAAPMMSSGPSALGQTRPALKASSRKKIIIIGAGLAGLVSAYHLMKKGHDVVVFEAQGRPGGRVLTVRHPFSDGLFTEVGAYYIPGRHRLVNYYLNHEFKLKLAPLLPREMSGQEVPLPYYMEGHHMLVRSGGKELVDAQNPNIDRWPAVDDEEKSGGLYRLRSMYTSLKTIDEKCNPLADVQEARWNPTRQGWPPSELKKYDDMTFTEFLTNEKRASPAAQALLKPWIAPFWDDFNNLSALSVLRETAIGRSFWDPSETFSTVDAGVETLPLAFAETLNGKIRYHCPVIGLDYDGKSAAVTYWESGQEKGKRGQTKEERGDHLICAIPFSILKNIKGISSFHIEKQKAIQQLNYTNVARVYLQCDQRKWQSGTTPWIGTVFTDLPVMNLIDTSFHQRKNSGILHAAMSGMQARLITLMKEKDRVDYVLEEVCKVYPEMRKGFEAAGERYFTKCWDVDEWTGGAYPIFRKGDVYSLTPHLATREAVVHFAGDHTSSRPGWMEGALESGHRAAHEIDESVSLPYRPAKEMSESELLPYQAEPCYPPDTGVARP